MNEQRSGGESFEAGRLFVAALVKLQRAAREYTELVLSADETRALCDGLDQVQRNPARRETG